MRRVSSAASSSHQFCISDGHNDHPIKPGGSSGRVPTCTYIPGATFLRMALLASARLLYGISISSGRTCSMPSSWSWIHRGEYESSDISRQYDLLHLRRMGCSQDAVCQGMPATTFWLVSVWAQGSYHAKDDSPSDSRGMPSIEGCRSMVSAIRLTM